MKSKSCDFVKLTPAVTNEEMWERILIAKDDLSREFYKERNRGYKTGERLQPFRPGESARWRNAYFVGRAARLRRDAQKGK